MPINLLILRGGTKHEQEIHLTRNLGRQQPVNDATTRRDGTGQEKKLFSQPCQGQMGMLESGRVYVYAAHDDASL